MSKSQMEYADNFLSVPRAFVNFARHVFHSHRHAAPRRICHREPATHVVHRIFNNNSAREIEITGVRVHPLPGNALNTMR